MQTLKMLALILLMQSLAHAVDSGNCPLRMHELMQILSTRPAPGMKDTSFEAIDHYLDQLKLENPTRRAEWKKIRIPHGGSPDVIAKVDPGLVSFVDEVSKLNAMITKAIENHRIPMAKINDLAIKHHKLLDGFIDSMSYELGHVYPKLNNSAHIWKRATKDRAYIHFKNVLESLPKDLAFVDYLGGYRGMQGELKGILHLPHVEGFSVGLGDVRAGIEIHQKMVSDAIDEKFAHVSKQELESYPILLDVFKRLDFKPERLRNWIRKKEIDVVHLLPNGKMAYTEIKNSEHMLTTEKVLGTTHDFKKGYLAQLAEVSEIVRFLKLENNIELEFLAWQGMEDDARGYIETQNYRVLDPKKLLNP